MIAYDDKEKAEDTHIWIIVKNKVNEYNKEPYVYLTNPKHHSEVKNVIEIKGKAWDIDGKVTKVKVKIYDVWYAATDTSGNGSWYTWSLEYNTSKLKNGWYRITAAAYDGQAWGDDYIYLYFNNTIVNKDPMVTITQPKSNTEVSGKVIISGTARDDASVKYVKIKIGDKDFEATDTSGNNSWYSWRYVWNTSEYENGKYRISAYVYDGLTTVDVHVYVELNNTVKSNVSSTEEDSSPEDNKADSTNSKTSSPLPGFESPIFLVAAAIAAVVVGFFRSGRDGNRTK